MDTSESYTAFLGARQVGTGRLSELLPVLKRRFDKDPTEAVLVFGDERGQIDFDLRGTIEEILERETKPPARGRGRPRLGVLSREISLLPRHWKWLEGQPQGLSASIRKLIDRAMEAQLDEDRARVVRASLGGVLTAIAGNRPNFEEAMRALYAGDDSRFHSLIQRWPKDFRAYADRRLRTVQPPATPLDGAELVAALYERVWSQGEQAAVEQLVAPTYELFSDPGDAWEGKRLDRDEYWQRVLYSRSAFPDLRFEVHELLCDGDRVSARWSAEGTQEGDLDGLPATGKGLRFAGQTIYRIEEGKVAGHWQVVDRLGFVQQLG